MESVIKSEEIKKWNDKPIYGIGLSDGQGGESFQVIPIGTPVSELVITPNPPYGNKIKWNKPNAGGGGGYQGKQRSGNESFALSYAKDYAVAKVTNGKEFKGEDILKLADLFYNWLEKKKSPEQPKQNPVVLASTLSTSKPPTDIESDSLPF